jgi:hypothetical protein
MSSKDVTSRSSTRGNSFTRWCLKNFNRSGLKLPICFIKISVNMADVYRLIYMTASLDGSMSRLDSFLRSPWDHHSTGIPRELSGTCRSAPSRCAAKPAVLLCMCDLACKCALRIPMRYERIIIRIIHAPKLGLTASCVCSSPFECPSDILINTETPPPMAAQSTSPLGRCYRGPMQVSTERFPWRLFGAFLTADHRNEGP